MKTSHFFLSATLVGFAFLSSCGGGGNNSEYTLPVGLQRSVSISGVTVSYGQDGDDDYISPSEETLNFAFEVESELFATIITGSNTASATADLHVVNYVPGDDTADRIDFRWQGNNSEGNNSFEGYVSMKRCTNVTKGVGTASCDVNLPFMLMYGNNCPGTINAAHLDLTAS